MMTGLLQWGMKQSGQLENQMTSVERVVEYSNLKAEPNTGDRVVPQWPTHGKIHFKDVSLRYSPLDPYVLKHLSFEISSGEKIGIVGRTGAGKSSLVSVFFRLAPVEGDLFIDGVNTKTLTLESLRAKISIIPQEPVLFSGTIRYNLDPFDEYQDPQLWEALDEVELKSVVADLPSGLSSKVSEGGVNFSVGQRQLLCLARAVVRMNKILILDEATANVDPQTDELIQGTIRRKFRGCTVLTIAHRLHTVMDCDKILVMEDGSVAEFDHPYTLLSNDSGVLCKLVQQTGKEVADGLRETAKKVQVGSGHAPSHCSLCRVSPKDLYVNFNNKSFTHGRVLFVMFSFLEQNKSNLDRPDVSSTPLISNSCVIDVTNNIFLFNSDSFLGHNEFQALAAVFHFWEDSSVDAFVYRPRKTIHKQDLLSCCIFSADFGFAGLATEQTLLHALHTYQDHNILLDRLFLFWIPLLRDRSCQFLEKRAMVRVAGQFESCGEPDWSTQELRKQIYSIWRSCRSSRSLFYRDLLCCRILVQN
jgi:ABC-type multidrug transport system ATPase subunit